MPVSDRQEKGDVIYRQDAIRILGAQCYRETDYRDICGKDCECAEYMALRDLPSAQQWIPCSERLPETHEEVLACDQDGIQRVYVLTRISDDEVGWEDDYGFYQSLEDIQAWMPLPEPYKGENAND